jgi:hypothetical protein
MADKKIKNRNIFLNKMFHSIYQKFLNKAILKGQEGRHLQVTTKSCLTLTLIYFMLISSDLFPNLICTIMDLVHISRFS